MFEEAKPVSKKLKVLLFGDSGSGKTMAALSFPKAAVIDAENGTDLYAGRPGIPPFSVLRVQTMAELDKAIEFIKKDGGKTFETLVVDPITVFYDVLLEAKKRSISRSKGTPLDDVDLGYKERASINTRMKGLYARLTGLPVHVVIIAREADMYENQGSQLIRTGKKPDADKSIKYMFDFVVQMNPDRSGTVVKSRGAEIGKTLKVVNWDAFKKIANLYVVGDEVKVGDEESAAEQESQLDVAKEFQNRDIVTAFFQHWSAQGVATNAVLLALGVEKASEWTQGRAAANEAVEKWRSENLVPE